MTNGWVDIKNTDMMLIMGGNPAENHPCGFKWAIEAKRNSQRKNDRGGSAVYSDRLRFRPFLSNPRGERISPSWAG